MKIRLTCLIICLAVLLTACGQKAPTWQEQYDLGVRYLSEGNYEEAIIAFTAAIEIDPKQAPAYVGRGDAYIGSGETGENLAAAQADYEMAIKLDEANMDAWLSLANIYIRQGDYEQAHILLTYAAEILGEDVEVLEGFLELPISEFPRTERVDFSEGRYRVDEYDGQGHLISSTFFDADDVLTNRQEYSYDSTGQQTYYLWDDLSTGLKRETFYEDGQIVKCLQISCRDDEVTSREETMVVYSGRMAEISYHLWDQGGIDSTTDMAFEMSAEGNSVRVTSAGWDQSTGLHVNSIDEIQRGSQDVIRIVCYDRNGNIESDEHF